MTTRIAASLLSADFSRLAAEIAEVERAGADLIHLDIMDGHFVPNLTFGPPVVRWLRPHTRLPLDAHLMVSAPELLIAELASLGVDRISVHVEACTHLHRTLGLIRSAGVATGVALNPATPLAAVAEILPWVDFVLVMSVNPGFGGQRFIPESVDKVRRLGLMAGARGLEIAVDGGVDLDTAGALADAGARTLIAGTSVFGAADRQAAIATLREAARKGES